MSNDTIELTVKQGRKLFELINEPAAGPHQDTVGPRHNPTTRTRAHAATHTNLHRFLKENGWLKNNQVLVCHGASCSDEFVVTKTSSGQWSVHHTPVG